MNLRRITMEQIFAVLFLVSFITSANSQRGDSIQKHDNYDGVYGQNLFVNESRQCGWEVLNTAAGRIQYKLADSLVSNERCTWLINVGNATGYSVGIFAMGFPGPTIQHKLTITNFNGNDSPNTITVDRLGMYDLNAAGILLITFHTGNDPNVIGYTGFLLEYTTYFQGDPLIENSHQAFFGLGSASGSLGYQMMASTRGLSMWFFIYNSEDYVHNPELTQKIAYLKQRAWSPLERIEAYAFHPDTNWQLQSWLNTTAGLVNTVKSNDALILLFRTSGPTPGSNSYLTQSFYSCVCN